MNINETDALDEFREQTKHKSRFIKYFIITATVYLAFTFLFSVFYIQGFSFTVRKLDWIFLVREFFVPVVGLIFFIAQKKAGWVICFLYFTLLSVTFSLILIINGRRDNHYDYSVKENWFLYTDLLLAISCTVLLLFKELRNDFKLSVTGFRIWVGVGLFLSICIFFATN